MSNFLYLGFLAACGAGFSVFSPWLPVFLASLIVLLGTAVHEMALGRSFVDAAIYSCLPAIILQTSYIVFGVFQSKRTSRARLETTPVSNNLPLEK